MHGTQPAHLRSGGCGWRRGWRVRAAEEVELPPMPELFDPDDEDESDPLDNWNLLRILHR